MGFDVKNTTFSGLLDMVFPYTCRGCGRLGSVLCERCKKYNICAPVGACPERGRNLYAFSYREGLVFELVKEYKYQAVRGVAKVLAECLDATIPKEIEQAVIVPLPTVRKHIRERGFDHMWLVAKELARRREGFSASRVMKRVGNTVQVGKDERTRKEQAARAYEIRDAVDPKVQYILVDDIWTTGASMDAAVSVMKKAGATRIASAVILVPR